MSQYKKLKDTDVFIEVSPLIEGQYTGIARVTLNTIRFFLRNFPVNLHFFISANTVERGVVEEAIEMTGGEAFMKKLLRDTTHFFQKELVNFIDDRRRKGFTTVAIYPNVRTNVEHYFDKEFQIIHDLSCLVTPQFQVEETVVFYGSTVMSDAKMSDFLVCVSNATKEDVQTYLGVPAKKLIVAHPGTDYTRYFNVKLTTNTRGIKELKGRQYIYVLGTVEPRKNLRIVLQYLDKYSQDNDLLLVFSGKAGWGKSFEKEVKDSVSNVAKVKDKILHLGYVSEEDKLYLLQNAKFTLYPSLYEGFGLPVLESMALGTPVLSSFSTSMPEIGGALIKYFDPFDVDDLREKIKEMITLSDDGELKKRLFERAKLFTWERFCEKGILDQL